MKSDPIISVLALALNDIAIRQAEQDKINELIHGVLQKNAKQITSLAESINSLSEGMVAVIASIQKLQTSQKLTSMPFRGIEIK